MSTDFYPFLVKNFDFRKLAIGEHVFIFSYKSQECCRPTQGFGAGAGVFGWIRSRHFGPAPASILTS